MKKEFMIATVAMAGLLIGCAGNKTDKDPVAVWQADRFNATEIAAANDAARPLTLEDVTYKSTIEQSVLAAPVNALAVLPASLYLKVVTEVDQMAADHNGRLLNRDVQEAISMGQIASKNSAAIKAWIVDQTQKYNENCAEDDKKDPEAEWKVYLAYYKSISQKNQDSVINDVVKPMLAKLTEESAKIGVAVLAIKEMPEFKALAGLEALKAGKNIAADSAALGSQFEDTIAGANLWLVLLEEDKAAKQYMKDYLAK